MEAAYRFIHDLEDEAEIPSRGIHSQTISDEGGIGVTLFAMAAGEQLSEHAAARPAIIHVLHGDGELVVAGDHHVLSPGSWLRMTARTPHALTARTAFVFALYLLPATDPQS